MLVEEKKYNFNRYLVWLIILLIMLSMGFADTTRGLLLPLIRDDFLLTQEIVGYLSSIPMLSYTIMCLLAGLLITGMGIRISVIIGFLLVGASFFAVLGAYSFALVLLIFISLSMGTGIFEVAVNSLAALVSGNKPATALNFIHFFYGAGAALGPEFINWFFSESNNQARVEQWRNVWGYSSLPFIIFILLSCFMKFPLVKKEQGKSSVYIMSEVVGDSTVWLLALSLGLMMGIEFGTKDWLPFQLKDCYNIQPERYITVFYIMFSFTRLALGWVMEKTGYISGLIYLLIITAVIYILAFSLQIKGVLLFPLTGLTIGLMFPTMIAVAIKIYPSKTASVIGVMVTISGLVTALISWLTGFINEKIGSAWGMRFFILYILISIIILVIIRKQTNRLYFRA